MNWFLCASPARLTCTSMKPWVLHFSIQIHKQSQYHPVSGFCVCWKILCFKVMSHEFPLVLVLILLSWKNIIAAIKILSNTLWAKLLIEICFLLMFFKIIWICLGIHIFFIFLFSRFDAQERFSREDFCLIE